MNYTFASLNVSTYSPDTHKVVPKDAIVLDPSALVTTSPFMIRQFGEYVRDEWKGIADFLDGVADQIEAQVKPPRIPEPGLWGVVEDAEGSHFLREGVGGSHNWVNLDVRSSGNTRWVDIKNPVLIRPGIE